MFTLGSYAPGISARKNVCLSLALLACAPIVRSLQAQVPSPLDFPASPSIVATGSAGSARWGEPGAASLNPSLAATAAPPVVEFSLFEMRQVDQQGLAAYAYLGGPHHSRLVVEFRQKGVDDLIDDPAVDESGLRVSDNALGIILAYALLGERVTVGAAARTVWSTVVATDGHAWCFDLGAAARPHPLLAFGVSLRRLGSGLRWEGPDGEGFKTGLALGIRFGVTVGSIPVGVLAVAAAADLETGAALGGNELGVGLELSVAKVAFFRAGLARPAAAEAIPTLGLGVSWEGFRLDLAYEALEYSGPRVHFAFSFRRRRPEAGERARN